MSHLIGIFRGAVNQVRSGHLGSLIDAIRVETESDLLEQAETLLADGYLAAAAVIAGGALETHLRHLVAKHGLTVTGHGSLSAYNQAIGQARKAGNEVYNANDGKLVDGWGGIRNEAAHGPGAFARSREEVGRMIGGIREFIARTATA